MSASSRGFISGTLEKYIELVRDDYNVIGDKRKEELDSVAKYARKRLMEINEVKFTFICTHNSRRSHLAQIWAQVAAYYFGIAEVRCYSGGTEATAFNKRAVEALRRAGLSINTHVISDNPVYKVSFATQVPEIMAFSKVYNDDFNPQSEYAAIMTCSDADENCPVVIGADKRFRLTYIDPKESDDSSLEAETYDLRCRQIATEMFYLFSQVSS